MLRILVRSVLIEGRVEDARSQFPQLKREIAAFARHDPSGNQKYLMWATKQMEGIPGWGVDEVIAAYERFHELASRLPKKDINSYKSLAELQNALSSAGQSKRQERQATKKNADKLFEDERWLLVHPKDTAASCFYGKGTQWCTAATEGGNAHDMYAAKNNFLYYLIDKQADERSKFSKVAVMFETSTDDDGSLWIDPDPEWYDAEDTAMSTNAVSEELSMGLERFVQLMRRDIEKRGKTIVARELELLETSDDPELIRELWEKYRYNRHTYSAEKIIKNEHTPDDVVADMLESNKTRELWNSVSMNRVLGDEAFEVFSDGLDELYPFVLGIRNRVSQLTDDRRLLVKVIGLLSRFLDETSGSQADHATARYTALEGVKAYERALENL